MQDTIKKLKHYVQAKNLRWTTQRQIIAETLFKAKQHLTTEELFGQVRRQDSSIGYATVSRTLHLLKDAGLCEQVDISDGSMRYEIVKESDHHDHLICTECGKFVEVFSPQLEKIQAELVSQHGFVEKSHKLQIFGMCSDCTEKSSQQ